MHNGARWLREQMDSVLAQEGVELEVIALDDVSTDDSLAILREYAARDPRVRVEANESNLGHLRSFEKCMALCTMPLIAPCDQDDVWEPRKLATLARAMGRADLAYCDSAYIDEGGFSLNRRLSQDLKEMLSGREALRFAFGNTVSGHALLVRRDVFLGARPFPALLYHDWWLALRAASGAGVVYVDRPLVRFRRHAGAASAAGKKAAGVQRKRSSSHNKRWLAQRTYVFEQLGFAEWFPVMMATRWLFAMQAAEAGRIGPLAQAVLRDWRSVPPGGVFAAPRFLARVYNKVRRAKRERSFYGPLFK
ncbi:Glycosyl transferase family 2 [Lysobacter dokdonensis DS-58]|uniref:Glycosyl transferase family 2 n=1 Tax=Lysobacter dokdonensis DS-58 TaxID=1300345 RepID=A0A0A2WIK5_9GAMM|nr:Glycosyl transferase family 2 [Lysobacter dokdonensis DS-58]